MEVKDQGGLHSHPTAINQGGEKIKQTKVLEDPEAEAQEEARQINLRTTPTGKMTKPKKTNARKSPRRTDQAEILGVGPKVPGAHHRADQATLADADQTEIPVQKRLRR